jgi:predicted nuclease of predicted toxin-antitoxin system
MRFVIDMNPSPAWAGYLRSAGHDAIHWSDVGPANAPDTDVMQWAVRDHRIVLTNDLDVVAILAASGSQHPSVVQLRSDALQPARLGPAVLAAVGAVADELSAGALLTIDAVRARLHILPLTSRS